MKTNVFQQRPFQADAGVMELLKDFPLPKAGVAPEVTSPASQFKTNALYKTKPEPGQKMSGAAKKEEELQIKPLTAEDIEQIRQAAFEEGISQGKEEGFSQGYQEGRDQGYQDGVQQGQAEGKKLGLSEGQSLIETQLSQLRLLLDQFQQPLLQVNAEVEQSLVQLALQMAQAVIAVEVTLNPKCILLALRQALEALPYQAEQVQVQLHPDDLAIIHQHFNAEEIQQRQWQLRAEPALQRCDVRLFAGDSSVDQTLKTRLQSSLEHFLQEQPQGAVKVTEP